MLTHKIKNILLAGLIIYLPLQPDAVWSAKRSAAVRFSSAIEIPIIVTHIIPLDHVSFDIPFLGNASAKTFGLRSEFSDQISGKNSLGRILYMDEIIATGDNQDIWVPSEFDKIKNTYRARSLYIIEYNVSTKKFTVQKNVNEEDCYIKQAGLGHLFERGTSATPTLPDLHSGKVTYLLPILSEPDDVGAYDRYGLNIILTGVFPGFAYDFFGGFDPVIGETRLGTGCYRKFHAGGDGSCITKSADIDPVPDVPESLFPALAKFDRAPPASLDEIQEGITIVHLEMENNLPAPLVRIDVDWAFGIRLDFTDYLEGRTPTYELAGRHDEFPLYTVHIGDQLIYGFDGVAAGNAALSLGDSENVKNVPDAGLLVSRPFTGEISLPIPANIKSLNLNPDPQLECS